MASDLVPRNPLGEEYVRMDGVMMKASYQEVINRIQRMEVAMVSSDHQTILFRWVSKMCGWSPTQGLEPPGSKSWWALDIIIICPHWNIYVVTDVECGEQVWFWDDKEVEDERQVLCTGQGRSREDGNFCSLRGRPGQEEADHDLPTNSTPSCESAGHLQGRISGQEPKGCSSGQFSPP